MNAICVSICCAIVLLSHLVHGGNVGDSCQVARSGATGVCAIITDCQPVLDDITKNGLFPEACGFRGREQIVCCPVQVTTTSTTTPAPIRISQRSKFCLCGSYFLNVFKEIKIVLLLQKKKNFFFLL